MKDFLLNIYQFVCMLYSSDIFRYRDDFSYTPEIVSVNEITAWTQITFYPFVFNLCLMAKGLNTKQ